MTVVPAWSSRAAPGKRVVAPSRDDVRMFRDHGVRRRGRTGTGSLRPCRKGARKDPCPWAGNDAFLRWARRPRTLRPGRPRALFWKICRKENLRSHGHPEEWKRVLQRGTGGPWKTSRPHCALGWARRRRGLPGPVRPVVLCPHLSRGSRTVDRVCREALSGRRSGRPTGGPAPDRRIRRGPLAVGPRPFFRDPWRPGPRKEEEKASYPFFRRTVAVISTSRSS